MLGLISAVLLVLGVYMVAGSDDTYRMKVGALAILACMILAILDRFLPPECPLNKPQDRTVDQDCDDMHNS